MGVPQTASALKLHSKKHIYCISASCPSRQALVASERSPTQKRRLSLDMDCGCSLCFLGNPICCECNHQRHRSLLTVALDVPRACAADPHLYLCGIEDVPGIPSTLTNHLFHEVKSRLQHCWIKVDMAPKLA